MSGNYALPYILTHPEMMAGFVVISPAASGIVPPSKVRALQVNNDVKQLNKTKIQLL